MSKLFSTFKDIIPMYILPNTNIIIYIFQIAKIILNPLCYPFPNSIKENLMLESINYLTNLDRISFI